MIYQPSSESDAQTQHRKCSFCCTWNWRRTWLNGVLLFLRYWWIIQLFLWGLLLCLIVRADLRGCSFPTKVVLFSCFLHDCVPIISPVIALLLGSHHKAVQWSSLSPRVPPYIFIFNTTFPDAVVLFHPPTIVLSSYLFPILLHITQAHLHHLCNDSTSYFIFVPLSKL